MAYCTKNDLHQRFGNSEIDQLIDRDNDGTEDAGVLDACIAYSDAMIDGYLAARYTIPITATSPLLVGISCDIVRYKLWDDNAPKEIRIRFDDAVRVLRDIANGVMTLPNSPAAAVTGGIDYFSNERVFTAETLSGY